MNHVLHINHTILNNSELILEIDSNFRLENVKASGQMLVDSLELSFVYLLENNDTYTYLKIPEIFWTNLKEVMTREISVSVTNGQEKINLVRFLEGVSLSN